MPTTFGALKTEVAEALRDPDSKTFADADLGRMVNEALAEVGRILPVAFQEDITPVADTLEYVVLSDTFDATANPDIEVVRVELWDSGETPSLMVCVIPHAGSGPSHNSDAGWSLWGGTLYLPRVAWQLFDGNEDTYLIRVWGYAPYPACTDDADAIAVSTDAEWAVVAYCRLIALERLLAERDLFTQWQTRAGNSDISPAGLMNAYNLARDEWRRRSRLLMRLRSEV